MNHKELANTDVDSEAIATAIARDGYRAALKAIRGAWALVWYDTKEKHLYLTNNGERPLCMLETPDLVLFGSEMPMLQWIAIRNRQGKFDTSSMKFIKKFELVQISVDGGYSFKEFDLTPDLDTKPAFQTPAVIIPPGTSGQGVTQHRRFSNSKGVEASDLEMPSLISTYPANTKVIVVPERVFFFQQDGGSPLYKMEGLAYRPGSPVVPCSAVLPPSINKLEDATNYCADPVMKAQVSYHMSETARYNRLVLKHLEDVTNWETWYQETFPIEEFEMLVESHKCKKCNGDLDINCMDLSSIKHKKDMGEYEVTCHQCVWENRASMPEPMRERLNEVVFETAPELKAAEQAAGELIASVKGSSHGS